jgi:hypothetical protein
VKITEFEDSGLVIEARRHTRLRVAYGDILTAERLPQPWRGLRLHVRKAEPLRVRCWGARRVAIEDELRWRGVRIVDEYGAMITPTLVDFEEELANEPIRLRQSSDDA